MNPNLLWQRLDDVYYTSRSVYDAPMVFGRQQRVRVSPLATLIAVSALDASLIEVYSLSGAKLWQMVYNRGKDDRIEDFCFHGECLVVLLGKRIRYYHDFRGGYSEHEYEKEEESEQEISENDKGASDSDKATSSDSILCVSSNHLVILKENLFIVDLSTFSTLRVPFPYHVDAMSVSGDLVFACCGPTVVTVGVHTGEVVDHGLTHGPFHAVAVSPNGQFVALWGDKVYVVTRQFDRVLVEEEVAEKTLIFSWSSNDAVCVASADEVRLIGPRGSVSFFSLNEGVPILCTVEDGVFVIGSHGTTFYGKVPECSRNVFGIGSGHPGSILMDCVDKLGSSSAKADASIALLKKDGTLHEALDTCLEVALEEFSPVVQKRALKAVSFGKAYTEYSAQKYVGTVRRVRALNQMRSGDVGLFLTHAQLTSVGPRDLLAMFLRRSLHLVALRVADNLGLGPYKSVVHVDWCCQKIRKEREATDEQLYGDISQKLTPHGPMDAVLAAAHEEGRQDLCCMLITLESRVERQVSHFMRYDHISRALRVAVEKGRDDLASLLLLHLQDTSLVQLFRILGNIEKKEASFSSSLCTFLGQLWVPGAPPKLVETFYKQEDRIHELNVARLQVPFLPSYYSDYKSRLLKSINSATGRSRRLFEKELEVLELQKRLGDVFREDFYKERSVSAILARLVRLGQLKTCAQVVRDFNVSQERWWYIAVDTYVGERDYDGLGRFVGRRWGEVRERWGVGPNVH